MAAVPRNIKKAMQPTLKRQANNMAASMRGLVPVQDGDLQRSIEVTPAGEQTPPYSQPGGSTTVPENAVAVTVGNADVRYAHLVEYGTMKTPAQPYFWPAVRLHRNKAQQAIKRGVSRVVKRDWGKS